MQLVGAMLALAGYLAAASAAPSGGPVESKQPEAGELVQVELLLEHAVLAPGEAALAALHFEIADGWHLYWSNPGDSGLPPRVRWTAPPGITVGEPLWPAPQRLTLPGGLLNYIYEDELTLLFPVSVAEAALIGEPITLKADIEWLVCREICLPGFAELEQPVQVGAQAKPSADAAVIAKAQAQLPRREVGPGGTTVRAHWAGGFPVLALWVEGAEELTFFPHAQPFPVPRGWLLKEGKNEGQSIGIPYPAAVFAEDKVSGVLEIKRRGGVQHVIVEVATPSDEQLREMAEQREALERRPAK